MKGNYIIYIVALFTVSFISSCGSSNKITSYNKKSHNTYSKVNTHRKPTSHNKTNTNSNSNVVLRSSKGSFSSKDASSVLKTAKSFLGVPYKYGGINESGFDCSGLVFVSFDKLGLKLPRNSSQQATHGQEIKISEVRKGDLVFFNTSGSSISHVGIIENIENTGEIRFIHSSTSKGVIISSLDENYWKTRFVKAVRLL
ncbi:C40 family peptidase [Faecalibacter rhinopitheci]|uniref:C40 family peptidase n=1 Tax=Faecalibacter rhinopitheci TaxID=2779678 RepID=A0A8J7FRT1_9FLAO|nr:C40 family peptidase [Faecalibacter rhinopitheci]MBF0596352.1 C40 family peptidase [Faecalibacter rhinopitheci]